MRAALAASPALLLAGAAGAQAIQLDPALELRARYEHVEQRDLPRDAEALTVRARPSLTARLDGWSVLVEAEAVVAPVNRYNDGPNSRAGYPVVADPENIELNRAQLAYASPGLAATAGRQQIALADERFVGPASWRQSERTFDAARLALGGPTGPSLDVSYARSVRTGYGREGRGALSTAIGGNNLFALLSYGTGAGTLTGFAYLVDQDDAAVQGYRLSSQTYGLRFAGGAPLRGVKLSYAAAWARQGDFHRNPSRYAATYGLAELGAAARGLSVLGGLEVLGADHGAALTSVQAPLASAFKFNGWAGKFTTTPPDGLRDGYAGVTYALPGTGHLSGVSLNAVWHDFRSDRAVRRYGGELDLLAACRRGPGTFSVRYARYDADRFATDTDKLWFQFDLSV